MGGGLGVGQGWHGWQLLSDRNKLTGFRDFRQIRGIGRADNLLSFDQRGSLYQQDMKPLTVGILLGASLLVISCKEKTAATGSASGEAAAVATADGHVLAKKNALPPVGKVRTEESSMEMKDAALDIEAGGQKMNGSMSRKDSKVETLEALSATKARRTLVSTKNEGKMVMNGQEQQTPSPSDPLTGLPVIIELKDGHWTATLETGTATPDQTTALAKVAKELASDDDYSMYGDTPRKPGDKWTVDPKNLTAFGDAEGLSGSFNVEFVEIKDVGGVSCAVLKTTFDIDGKAASKEGEPGMSMKLKGESVVNRSLADQMDIDGKIDCAVSIEGSPAPQVQMTAKGPMQMTTKASLK